MLSVFFGLSEAMNRGVPQPNFHLFLIPAQAHRLVSNFYFSPKLIRIDSLNRADNYSRFLACCIFETTLLRRPRAQASRTSPRV